MKNSFVWADLSTFEMAKAQRFYCRCLGWQYQTLPGDYCVCGRGDEPAAGLFVMPEKFQQIGMPSFWMSYIQVADLAQTVSLAETHGGKIKIRSEAAPGGGRIALIRDPAGAGFTCYEGDALGTASSAADRLLGPAGTVVWNELHVSDFDAVKPFYETVFGWQIRPTSYADRYELFNSADDVAAIAGITVRSNEVKGDKEYWGVYFAVDDLASAQLSIEKNGGQIVAEDALGSRATLLAYDPCGAAFYLVAQQSNTRPSTGPSSDVNQPSGWRWRALLGLALVAVAVFTNAQWFWGLLFLLWVVPDIKSGSTYFFEFVERRHNPLVYWAIIATWLLLSVYMLVEGVG